MKKSLLWVAMSAALALAACEGSKPEAQPEPSAEVAGPIVDAEAQAPEAETRPLQLQVREFVSEDGQRLRVDSIDDEHVRLPLPDGPEQVFEVAVSASGARFTAGEWEWWEHQGEGTLRRGEDIVFQGQMQEAEPIQP